MSLRIEGILTSELPVMTEMENKFCSVICCMFKK